MQNSVYVNKSNCSGFARESFPDRHISLWGRFKYWDIFSNFLTGNC